MVENFEIASRRRRLAAFGVDQLLVSLLAVGAGFLAVGRGWDELDFDTTTARTVSVIAGAMAIYLLKDSVRGRSPGKLLFGLAVRDQTDPNSEASIARLVLRNFTIMIWPIEVLALALSRQKSRLGDLLAKTVVVRSEGAPRRIRLTAVVILIVAATSFVVASGGAMIRSSAAYEQATAYIRSSPDIIDRIGSVTSFGPFPTGSISSMNDYGRASLALRVRGEKGAIVTTVHLEKMPGEPWEVMEIVTGLQ